MRSTPGSSSAHSAWPASWNAITRRSCSVSARRTACRPRPARARRRSRPARARTAGRGRRDRRLVGDVGQVGAGQARGLARDRLEVDVRRRACRACGPSGSPRGRATSGGETRIWRSKRPGRSSAGSSLSSRLDAAITTTSPLPPKPSISTSSWLSVCSRSELLSEPRRGADGVDLVDEDDRRRVLAGLVEQAPDARGAEAGEHLDEARRRLREELRAGLVGHGLGQQRLARAGRAVQQDALRAPSRRARWKRSGSRRKSTTSCSSALASSAPATSSHLIEAAESGLISCGLVLRHHLHHPPQEEDDQRHEDDRGTTVRMKLFEVESQLMRRPKCGPDVRDSTRGSGP